MSDDYLWDRSGPPDRDIERLEQLLGALRTTPAMPEWPVTPARVRWRGRAFLAAAASLVLACAGTLWLTLAGSAAPSWSVVRVDGRPEIDGARVSGTGRLAVGKWLQTDGQSRASVAIADIGRLDVEPDTRLRLLASGVGRHQMEMARGTVHATIWAPPGEFVVDTPYAVAVDLGCVYTLHVDDSGAGLLRTTMGWVGFKLNGHESFIPAGAICQTRPKIGPGTPYMEDASASFRDALSRFDFESHTPAERSALLGTLLVDARKDDALTLWHLLSRVSDADRPGLYGRLASLAPPPEGVTREGILRLDRQMLDAWWSSFGFGDIHLWRTYERDWSQPNTK